MLLTITEILSNSLVLTVLLFSVLIGFAITFVILLLFDSRVFDVNGRLVPSPNNHLWGNSFYIGVIQFGKFKQISKVIQEKYLPEVGDGNIVAVNIFGHHYVIIAHPEMVKVVLSGHHLKFPKTERCGRLRSIFGSGLFTSGGSRWQAHRHLINSSFHAESLKDMVHIFDKQSKQLVAQWAIRLSGSQRLYDVKNGAEVNLCLDLGQLALGVICQSAFGGDMRAADLAQVGSDLEALLAESHQMQDMTDWRSFLPTNRTEAALTASDRMKVLLESAVVERLERHLARYRSKEQLQETARVEDLLDLLIAASDTSQKFSDRGSKAAKLESKLSPGDLRDHLMTFLLLGHETCASTLMWILYELCLHPHEQTTCQEEIDSVLFSKKASAMPRQNRYRGDNEGSAEFPPANVTFEDVPRFEYLMQVIKETLRLHPTVPTIARESVNECLLGEYRMRAGCTVVVNSMALHRHPDFWVRPDEFDPDRFSRENQRMTIQHPFQYIPFSSGPRNCIGQRFAQMELIVVLANLLSAFTFSLPPGELRNNVGSEEGFTYRPTSLTVLIAHRERANVSGNVC